MSCLLRFSIWRGLIDESKQLFKDKLKFVFYANTDKKEELRNLADMNYIDGVVYLDPDNITFKRNRLPKDTKYSCFLLDSENKVIAVGNPSVNSSIWELYKNKIRKGG